MNIINALLTVFPAANEVRVLNKTDNEFFEQYKRLNKLCCEIYDCQNGVSAYIEQMENDAYEGRKFVRMWDSDYKSLKHVRYIRNRLAHDYVGSQLSDQNDIVFVQSFYKRILSGNDPLAVLEKSKAAKKKAKKQPVNHNKKKQNNTLLLFVTISLVILVLLFIAAILILRFKLFI